MRILPSRCSEWCFSAYNICVIYWVISAWKSTGMLILLEPLHTASVAVAFAQLYASIGSDCVSQLWWQCVRVRASEPKCVVCALEWAFWQIMRICQRKQIRCDGVREWVAVWRKRQLYTQQSRTHTRSHAHQVTAISVSDLFIVFRSVQLPFFGVYFATVFHFTKGNIIDFTGLKWSFESKQVNVWTQRNVAWNRSPSKKKKQREKVRQRERERE